MTHARNALARPLAETPDAARPKGGITGRFRRWLRRVDTGPLTPDAIDWHERFATARAGNDLRRATAICRAALSRQDTVGWWLRLARCQAERDFYVDALDAIETALDRTGPTGEVREEARRLLAAAERAAARDQGASAMRLRAAVQRLQRRLAGG